MEKPEKFVALRFSIEALRKVVDHVRRSTHHSAAYGQRPQPGVFFVKDEGIYLMSTGLSEPPAVFADTFAPSDEDVHARSGEAVGGDDFGVFLGLEHFAAALAQHSDVILRVSATRLQIVTDAPPEHHDERPRPPCVCLSDGPGVPTKCPFCKIAAAEEARAREATTWTNREICDHAFRGGAPSLGGACGRGCAGTIADHNLGGRRGCRLDLPHGDYDVEQLLDADKLYCRVCLGVLQGRQRDHAVSLDGWQQCPCCGAVNQIRVAGDAVSLAAAERAAERALLDAAQEEAAAVAKASER